MAKARKAERRDPPEPAAIGEAAVAKASTAEPVALAIEAAIVSATLTAQTAGRSSADPRGTNSRARGRLGGPASPRGTTSASRATAAYTRSTRCPTSTAADTRSARCPASTAARASAAFAATRTSAALTRATDEPTASTDAGSTALGGMPGQRDEAEGG